MRTAKAKVYFEYWPKTEEFDEDLQFDVIVEFEKDYDVLAFEIENVGVNMEWFEGIDLTNYKTGHYEVEYELDTESEHCDGYWMYDYNIIVGIVNMKYLDAR